MARDFLGVDSMNAYSFWRELFIVLDEFCNVLLGGYAGESMSARAYRAHKKGLIFGRLFMGRLTCYSCCRSRMTK